MAQINSDGEYIYWSYIAPASDAEAIRNSVPLNIENPLHHSGIKRLAAKANEDGSMPTEVTFAIEDIEAYGVCGAVYVEPEPEPLPEPVPGDVNGDGEVDIADINAVIDVIMGRGEYELADVNEDGEVNIGDVNALIEIIQSQEAE